MKVYKIKTPWYTAIMNLIGLGIAFSIFLILMSQVWWDFRYDRFDGGKDVYVVESPSSQEGLYGLYVVRPVIQMVADSSPEIAVACDYIFKKNDPIGILQIKNKEGQFETVFGSNYAETETSALDVFNVILTRGRREDFAKEGDALISESAAKCYYPDRDPIGETILFELDREYRINGIYEDRNENESMVNGFLIHEGERDKSLPNRNAHTCYIKLRPDANVEAVREAVGKVQLGEIEKDLRITQIHDSWFEKHIDRWGTKDGGNKLLCILLTAIAILFLGIAGFNYINFAMASIPFRIMDINTRKVFGASRSSLVLNQLFHATIMVGGAFLIGILAMRTISGTAVGSFLSWSMTPERNIPVICIGAMAAIIFVAIVGLVPALYSTSFQPALVLKGPFALSMKGGGLRTFTIALQYILSFIFILCAITLQCQTSYMVNNQELGFNYDRVLKMDSNVFGNIESVALKLRDIPGVEDVTKGEAPMQEDLSSMTEIHDKASGNVVQYSWRAIPTEYAKFFDLQLVDGRLPFPGEEHVALVNESFLEAVPSFGIGKEIPHFIGSYLLGNATIIGILKDFHALSFENAYSPLVFFIGDKWNYSSIMMRLEPNADVKDIIAKARSIYGEMMHVEDEGIETSFLNEDIKKLYEREIRLTRLIRLSSLLSFIIVLIGILGVIWLDTRSTRKEIAIRKVNGATREEIMRQIGKKYLLIAAVSFVIAAPVAIAICQRWLQHFAFRIKLPVWTFILALVVVLWISLVTVWIQAWQAANANPVESLKNE